MIELADKDIKITIINILYMFKREIHKQKYIREIHMLYMFKREIHKRNTLREKWKILFNILIFKWNLYR